MLSNARGSLSSFIVFAYRTLSALIASWLASLAMRCTFRRVAKSVALFIWYGKSL